VSVLGQHRVDVLARPLQDLEHPLDLRRVARIEASAARILVGLLDAFAAGGKQVVFSGAGDHGAFLRLLETHIDEGPRRHAFAELDSALEWCENQLLATDAARAAWASRARVVIPLHWGTFPYWIFGGNERPRDEETMKRLPGDALHVLAVGQSLPLSAAPHQRDALP